MVLSVCICWFHGMFTLHSWHFYTFGAWSYQCSLSSFISISFHMLKRSWAHALSCFFEYCYFANIEYADVMWFIFSWSFWHNLHLKSHFVCNTLLRDILFLMPGLVLILFNFRCLLSDLRSTAIGTCHVRYNKRKNQLMHNVTVYSSNFCLF
jgi:hypothetical protein